VEGYLNMTRQLLTALGTKKQVDDNYAPLMDNQFEDDFQEVEYPTGFFHLISILLKTNEKKMLALSNPDGYFYLYYIKTCIKCFWTILLLCSGCMAYIKL
jgi:hypothetical protein